MEASINSNNNNNNENILIMTTLEIVKLVRFVKEIFTFFEVGTIRGHPTVLGSQK